VERHSHKRITIFKPNRLLPVRQICRRGKLTIDFKVALCGEQPCSRIDEGCRVGVFSIITGCADGVFPLLRKMGACPDKEGAPMGAPSCLDFLRLGLSTQSGFSIRGRGPASRLSSSGSSHHTLGILAVRAGSEVPTPRIFWPIRTRSIRTPNPSGGRPSLRPCRGSRRR
jgi:hypothetical protein